MDSNWTEAGQVDTTLFLLSICPEALESAVQKLSTFSEKERK